MAVHPAVKHPDVYALNGLICFHSARLDSKLNEQGGVVSLKDQDRSTWDKDQICLGHASMFEVVKSDEFSMYHFEAAIASEHVNAVSFATTTWKSILQWYKLLHKMRLSFMNQMSMAKVYRQLQDFEKALELLNEIEPSSLEQRTYLFQGLKAEYFYLKGEGETALTELELAISKTSNENEKNYLRKKLDKFTSSLNIIISDIWLSYDGIDRLHVHIKQSLFSFALMLVQDIIEELVKMRDFGKRMFLTSSFQTHSIPLLDIVSKSGVKIPIYCLNTGFLFPETLAFRDELAEKLALDIRTISSSQSRHQQKDSSGRLFFASDPDYCCYLNKVEPTDKLLQEYDVWVNGVRADQNLNRRNMKTYQRAKHAAVRFHPMLDWSGKDIYTYIKEHDLPRHPLDSVGYESIGCMPCTRKTNLSDPRAARWFGLNKTECGLHTDLGK